MWTHIKRRTANAVIRDRLRLSREDGRQGDEGGEELHLALLKDIYHVRERCDSSDNERLGMMRF